MSSSELAMSWRRHFLEEVSDEPKYIIIIACVSWSCVCVCVQRKDSIDRRDLPPGLGTRATPSTRSSARTVEISLKFCRWDAVITTEQSHACVSVRLLHFFPCIYKLQQSGCDCDMMGVRGKEGSSAMHQISL
eukprot:COSAG05_NODE_87_length_20404_cov_42.272051_6_plen_133_part_00